MSIFEKNEGVNRDSSAVYGKQIEQQLQFSLYPNLANDGISILSIESFDSMNEAMLVVTNVLNQSIIREPIMESKIIIDLNGQPTGLYMVSVIQNGKLVYSSRLINE